LRSSAGKAWGGFLASLFLHLAVAGVVLYGVTPGPAPVLRVIDLSLLPPSAGGDRGPGQNVAPAAGPSPAAVSARPTIREEPSPEAIPAESSQAASSPSVSSPAGLPRAASSPGALPSLPSSPAASVQGNGPGAGAFFAPSSPLGGGTSPVTGYGYLREAIQREISYPAVARRMGWEGRVVVAFVILPDGAVRDVRVVHGSGFSVLDRNAMEAVRSASPFPHPPAEAEVLTPVVYRLD